MKNSVVKILFLTWILAIAHLMFVPEAWAASGYTTDSAGLFDKSILEGIQVMMIATYKTLGNVLMIGHALMCYAIDVDYRSILGLIEIPNISFLLVGLAIYIVGVFMALSVGMYFVDASLRLGLAIVFMPVSIALWPFPPTSSKFMNNLSTIIRNSMLFVLMSVGIAFAICLIQAGLFEGGSQAFWNAIAEEKTEAISENFSFFSSHILVVGFCLVFGFRILESTVNDYLNSLFSDAMVGSENPMSEMGTQAFGMFTQTAVKPVMSYVGDVATHQAGNLISAAGDKMVDLSTDEGIQNMKAKYQNIKNVIRNPRQAYNNMMNNFGGKVNEAVQSVGERTNQAIQATGEGLQNLVDGITSVAPIPMSEEDRQALLHGGLENGQRTGGVNDWIQHKAEKWGNAAQAAIDPKAKAIGQGAEEVIAHGGGAAKEAAKQGISHGIAAARNGYNEITGSDAPEVSAEEVREELHEAKEKVGEAIQERVVNPTRAAAQRASQAFEDSTVGQAVSEFREGYRQGRNPQAATPQTAETRSASAAETAAEGSAPVTLQPSGAFSQLLQGSENMIPEIRQMAQNQEGATGGATPTPTGENAGETGGTDGTGRTNAANNATGTNGANTTGNANNSKSRIFFRKTGEKTGRFIFRASDVAERKSRGFLGALGRGTKDFGNWLGNNYKEGQDGQINSFAGMIRNIQHDLDESEAAKAREAYEKSLWHDGYDTDKGAVDDRGNG